MKPASIPFDETSGELLKDPEIAMLYLAEFLEDKDGELFKLALGHVAEAGWSEVIIPPDSASPEQM